MFYFHKKGNIKLNNSDKKEKEKLSFFKKILISIKDFEKYGIFIKESIGQTILYIVLLILLFTIILTCATSKKLIDSSNSYMSKLKEKIYSITYEDDNIFINEDKKLEIADSELIQGKLLINTSNLNEEEIDSYRKELDKENNLIVILKDRLFIKNEVNSLNTQITYSDIAKNNEKSVELFKSIIDNWNNDKFNVNINISLILGFFIVCYYIYILDALTNALILAITCYITSKLLKLKMKFASAFSISTHAITLPIILNLIYVIIRFFTNFEIPYFNVMYYGIAYVYIITTLFMLKSDNIKMQIDLQKIMEVQEQIKEELEKKEREEKEQKEKEDVKKRDKEKSKPQVNDKPEGNNA